MLRLYYINVQIIKMINLSECKCKHTNKFVINAAIFTLKINLRSIFYPDQTFNDGSLQVDFQNQSLLQSELVLSF